MATTQTMHYIIYQDLSLMSSSTLQREKRNGSHKEKLWDMSSLGHVRGIEHQQFRIHHHSHAVKNQIRLCFLFTHRLHPLQPFPDLNS